MSTVTGWRKRTIVEMAREAGIRDCTCNGQFGCLDAFAELVRADERTRTWTQEHWTEYERSIAAAEREACAKVCEQPGWNAANWCAKAIRARGQA